MTSEEYEDAIDRADHQRAESKETPDLAKAVQNLAREIGEQAQPYSGRGMFGRECWAISCRDTDNVISYRREYNLPKPHIDNLGKGYIVYWPEIPYKR